MNLKVLVFASGILLIGAVVKGVDLRKCLQACIYQSADNGNCLQACIDPSIQACVKRIDYKGKYREKCMNRFFYHQLACLNEGEFEAAESVGRRLEDCIRKGDESCEQALKKCLDSYKLKK